MDSDGVCHCDTVLSAMLLLLAADRVFRFAAMFNVDYRGFCRRLLQFVI